MAYSFSADWAQEIADVSTRPEFQTARVEIVDPSQVETEYDYETGEIITVGDGVIYSGRARVIGINRPTNIVSGQMNTTSLSGVRVQVPREGTTDLAVTKGMVLYVREAPRQPRLKDYVFTAVGDFQGSSSAARTFEFSVDQDSVNSGE